MHRTNKWTLLLAMCVCAFISLNGFADDLTITLQSGEVIHGTLIGESDGVVVINHAILGKLNIKRAQIARMEPTPPLGPRASLNEPAKPDGITRRIHSGFTNPDTSSDFIPDISAPNDPDALASRTRPHAGYAHLFANNSSGPLELAGLLRTQSPPEQIAPAPVAKDASEWKGHVELNATFVSADNSQLDLRTAAQALRDTADDRFKAYAEYYLRTLSTSGSGVGSVTDNNLLANITYDRFLNPTPWLWFGKGQYQYDANQGWENRVQGWGGLGYRFFDDPNLLLLTGKIGVGATHEFGIVDTTQPSGYAEIALGWQISQRQKLSLSTYISPDLSHVENYFVQTRFEWSMKLDIHSGLSLVTGLRNDYQSQPVDNASGNDFRGYAGLKLEF